MASSFLQNRLDLACEPSAVHFARSHTEDVLKQWQMPEEVRFDALTIVVELTTNAVRHAGGPAVPFAPEQGRPPAVRRCALTLWVTNTRLHVGMWDQSAQSPVLRPFSPEATSGRGIQMVNGLSEGLWGSAPAEGGKIVWAAIPLPVEYRRRLSQIGSLSQGFVEAMSA
ncbi:ATP-binding protein [Streptomyces sp. CBMA29]|uniref:ATP-binding protein n=1 Tax=Streptomyces sp. CBMA29 TaxID=1896314 RepID=UPI001661EAAC|nr:ATP-binding protein [Streptomyces sp. CBMA29]